MKTPFSTKKQTSSAVPCNLPSPNHIASISFLVQQMRKFLAKKRNPVQYELNNILRNALLTLEKRGEVKREQGYRGEKITNKTRFALINVDS